MSSTHWNEQNIVVRKDLTPVFMEEMLLLLHEYIIFLVVSVTKRLFSVLQKSLTDLEYVGRLQIGLVAMKIA